MPFPSTLLSISTLKRQSLFYVLLFAGTGASLPFMPVWFKAHGMSGAEIGFILALPQILRIAWGPLVGVWADRFARFRTPLIWLSSLGALGYGLLYLGLFTGPFRLIYFTVFWCLGYSFVNSINPLLDTMTFQMARRRHFPYTLPRAAGSASFVAVNILIGMLLLASPVDAIWLWLVVSGVLTGFAGRLILEPDLKHEDKPGAEKQAEAKASEPSGKHSGVQRIGHLIRHPGYAMLVIAVGLVIGSQSFYFVFSNIIWREQGLSTFICGLLWATGVGAEIIFMVCADRIRRRFGPWLWLIAGGVFSTIRWAIMMASPPLWALWPLQCLHAFTFASSYLAGLELIQKSVPKGYESLGQVLNAAFGNGLTTGLGMLASGVLYEMFGAKGYGLMAVMCVIGATIAFSLYRQSLSHPNLTPKDADPAD
jgi:MFS transporter, PPP family, 3-phenylpropionic acid transporter